MSEKVITIEEVQVSNKIYGMKLPKSWKVRWGAECGAWKIGAKMAGF